jgi:hypothetical protein
MIPNRNCDKNIKDIPNIMTHKWNSTTRPKKLLTNKSYDVRRSPSKKLTTKAISLPIHRIMLFRVGVWMFYFLEYVIVRKKRDKPYFGIFDALSSLHTNKHIDSDYPKYLVSSMLLYQYSNSSGNMWGI